MIFTILRGCTFLQLGYFQVNMLDAKPIPHVNECKNMDPAHLLAYHPPDPKLMCKLAGSLHFWMHDFGAFPTHCTNFGLTEGNWGIIELIICFVDSWWYVVQDLCQGYIFVQYT